MTESIETFASLHAGSYTARFVDGRLDRLTFAPGDAAELQDERIVEVLNAAQERHAEDTVAALDAGSGPAETADDRELTQYLDDALARADRAVAQSPSLQRELEQHRGTAQRIVGRSRSCDAVVTLAGARLVAVELAATLRAERQQVITAALDEALADAWGQLRVNTVKTFEDALAQLTPQVVAKDAADVLANIRRGRTSW